MPMLDLRAYGLPAQVELAGDVREEPATDDDPTKAPLILLIDEVHDAPAVVQENANNAIAVLRAVPDTLVVLEHFLAGTRVTASAPAYTRASDFHKLLLSEVPTAHVIGGDDRRCLDVLSELKEDMCDRPNRELDDEAIRRLRRGENRETVRGDFEPRRVEVATRYLAASNEHECQRHRSHSFVRVALDSGSRVAIINAGGNHNTHIVRNEGPEGSPLISNRQRISVIRIRCPAYPNRGE